MDLVCARRGKSGPRVIVFRMRRGEWCDRTLCSACVRHVGPASDLHPPEEENAASPIYQRG